LNFHPSLINGTFSFPCVWKEPGTTYVRANKAPTFRNKWYVPL
jgi:hypothetical protein